MMSQRSDYIAGPARVMLERFASEVWAAFSSVPYLVGSALERPDYRDVDIRVILPDDRFAVVTEPWEPWQRDHPRMSSLCLAFSVLGQHMTGLPIDFQIQRMSDANRDFPGRRQPLIFAPGRINGGKRWLSDSDDVAQPRAGA